MWAVSFWILVSWFLLIKTGVTFTAALIGGGAATLFLYLVCLCVLTFDGVD